MRHIEYNSAKDINRGWKTITPQFKDTQLYNNGTHGTPETDNPIYLFGGIYSVSSKFVVDLSSLVFVGWS